MGKILDKLIEICSQPIYTEKTIHFDTVDELIEFLQKTRGISQQQIRDIKAQKQITFKI